VTSAGVRLFLFGWSMRRFKMLSDVLSEAIYDAREYQKNYPDIYQNDEVETVLALMEILNSYFWIPPHDEYGDVHAELKKALPTVKERTRCVKSWNQTVEKLRAIVAAKRDNGGTSFRREEKNAQRYAFVIHPGSALFGTVNERREKLAKYKLIKVFTEEEYSTYYYPLCHKLGVVKALDAMGPGLKFKQSPDFELIPQLQAVNE
jgi:hypothetical protein